MSSGTGCRMIARGERSAELAGGGIEQGAATPPVRVLDTRAARWDGAPMQRRRAKDDLFAAFATAAKALGSGRRAEIVDVLAQGERSVDELAREIGQSVANTSQHLQILAGAGFVTGRRDGARVYYRLASERVLDLWF